VVKKFQSFIITHLEPVEAVMPMIMKLKKRPTSVEISTDNNGLLISWFIATYIVDLVTLQKSHIVDNTSSFSFQCKQTKVGSGFEPCQFLTQVRVAKSIIQPFSRYYLQNCLHAAAAQKALTEALIFGDLFALDTGRSSQLIIALNRRTRIRYLGDKHSLSASWKLQ